MVFKRRNSADLVPDDPEQLYRQLALVNDGPEALWAHQADVLRSWHGNHPDIGNHRNQNVLNGLQDLHHLTFWDWIERSHLVQWYTGR